VWRGDVRSQRINGLKVAKLNLRSAINFSPHHFFAKKHISFFPRGRSIVEDIYHQPKAPMIKIADTMEDRARQADLIIRQPEQYKICCGCDSILKARVAVCPNCSTYRFEEASVDVVAQARKLGTRLRTTVICSDLV
jgi:hypothetical protein